MRYNCSTVSVGIELRSTCLSVAIGSFHFRPGLGCEFIQPVTWLLIVLSYLRFSNKRCVFSFNFAGWVLLSSEISSSMLFSVVL